MRPNREFFDKGWLLIALLTGSGGILYLKLLEWPVEYTVGFPLLVLLAYWLLSLVTSAKSAYESIGDNCYYLGFVFTLVSLAVTLYRLNTDGEAGAGDSVYLDTISGFGVALSSTIFGIMLRIMMLKAAPADAFPEGMARKDLDLAVRDFRIQLSSSLGELRRCSVETAQMMAEQRDAVRNVLKEDIEAHRQTAQSGASAMARLYENAENALSDHRAAWERFVRQDAGAYQKAVQEAVADFRKALGGATAALSESEAEVRESLRRNLQAREESTAAAARLSEEAEKALSDHRASWERFVRQDAGAYQKAVQEAVADFRKALGGATAAFSESEAEVRESLQRDLESRRQSLESGTDSLRKTLDHGLEALARYREEADKLASLSRTTVEQTNGAGKTALSELDQVKALTGDTAPLSGMQTNMAVASAQFADAAKRLETTLDALCAAADRIGGRADRKAKSSWNPFRNIFSGRSR